MRSIINEKNLNNKKILLRLDLNVPLEKDKITDTTRIDKILPTLNFLIKEKAQIIILSHIGRPKGKTVKELSLQPITKELENKLKKKVKLIHKNIKEIKNKSFFDRYDQEILY
jgi:3-phosphoglycerate kinase